MHSNAPRFAFGLDILVALGACPPVAGEVLYHITDLGTGMSAYAINEAEQIVGDKGHLVFLWEDGVGTELGFAGWAYDINEATQVVGILTGGPQQAFLWESGEVTVLGTFGGSQATAFGINDPGQVVGWAHNPDNERRAYVYADGVMTDLGTLGGAQSWAFGVNNAGQVVGKAETDVVPPGGLPIRRAFLYSEGVMTAIAGDYSAAYDINEAEQIVGTYLDGSFLWEDGVLTNLGALTRPEAINNVGQVVGWAWPDGYDAAFIWQDGLARDLNNLISPDSGWTRLERASDINDAGQIIGWGRRDDGSRHGFLLTLIPEPGSLMLLAFGALPLLRRRRQAG
jgi:probable HAF family extracellular repeat protein